MGRFSVRLRRKALADLREIRAWYRLIDSTVEERFLEALKVALDRIQSNPLMYQVVYRSTRRVLLDRFPYSVFYLVREPDVIVLSVIHHKRNPELARSIAE